MVNKTSKRSEKIAFFIILIQAIAAGAVYLYCKMNQWNIIEELTVFLYPVFSILLFVYIILSFSVSLVYFIKKISDTKKFYHGIPAFVMLTLIILSNIFFNEAKLRQYNFKKYQYIRQDIAEQILTGQLVPDETGTVHLPDSFRDEAIARGGRVDIVDYEGKQGIYFCTFSGVLDSTAGFVFLTQDMGEHAVTNNTVVLQESYAKGWYYCGTDS